MKCIITMTNGRATIVEADSCQEIAEAITRKGSMVPRLALIGDVYVSPQHVCSVEAFTEIIDLIEGDTEQSPGEGTDGKAKGGK